MTKKLGILWHGIGIFMTLSVRIHILEYKKINLIDLDNTCKLNEYMLKLQQGFYCMYN